MGNREPLIALSLASCNLWCQRSVSFSCIRFSRALPHIALRGFRFSSKLLLLMTSGQVLITRCEPSPASPSSLDEGQIWKLKVNSGSPFYRSCAVWLDPGGTEGKKVRRVPYFMAARIASCACRFATPEQHASVGIVPTWSATRVRGSRPV